MTVIQERAFEMIKRMPDDKVYYVVKMLEGMESLSAQTGMDGKTKEQKAYENLQRFRKCSNTDADYKAELTKALEEKYESAD